MRVAAIDLGTNSTRLLVADVDGSGVQWLARETRITRLGEGVDERHRLLPLPIARVRNVLTDFRRQAEELGAERSLAVATSAVRDAENGEAFLGEVEWSYGFATRLASGDDEAELTLRGVSTGRDLDEGTLVVDVGGGSTELIAADFRVSLDVGSVRLTERFLHSDPPTTEELDASAKEVKTLLADRVPDEIRERTSTLVGVAGTITTLAALELHGYDPNQVHGHVLTPEVVALELARLASVPVDERRRLAGLEPERAPVIVGGAIVVRELMSHFGVDTLEVSERDLLDGIALDAAALPAPVEGDAPPGAYTCC
jgi:exopolyphosphatase/guanosine-5'-triphosphate,3'-diphosphate pyrophosphatase